LAFPNVGTSPKRGTIARWFPGVRDIEVGIKPPGAPPNSPQSDH